MIIEFLFIVSKLPVALGWQETNGPSTESLWEWQCRILLNQAIRQFGSNCNLAVEYQMNLI